MFSRSPAGRLAWKTRKGLSVQRFSPTGCWIKYEVMRQEISYLETFFEGNWPSCSCNKTLHNPNDAADLDIELVPFVDGCVR